ncbi:MAG TPA: COQ9 family protein [Alphaproteobacteria bacterium]
MTTSERERLRRRVLEAALGEVPGHGWTWQAVEAGARDAGLDAAAARRAFPRGIGEAYDFFLAEADRRMIEALERKDLAALPVRERIATAVRVRLEQAEPHREAVRRALALQLVPDYALGALPALARTVDAMWRAAGDTATDFNYYTKRALLAAVYGATLLYWLDDRSPGYAETWAFLDRRIDDVMGVEKLRARARALAAELDAPLKRLLARLGRGAARDWQPPPEA